MFFFQTLFLSQPANKKKNYVKKQHILFSSSSSSLILIIITYRMYVCVMIMFKCYKSFGFLAINFFFFSLIESRRERKKHMIWLAGYYHHHHIMNFLIWLIIFPSHSILVFRNEFRPIFPSLSIFGWVSLALLLFSINKQQLNFNWRRKAKRKSILGEDNGDYHHHHYTAIKWLFVSVSKILIYIEILHFR